MSKQEMRKEEKKETKKAEYALNASFSIKSLDQRKMFTINAELNKILEAYRSSDTIVTMLRSDVSSCKDTFEETEK